MESGFNPHARSPKGAMGLMQLMPGTARDLGVSNARGTSRKNIRGGVQYPGQLMAQFRNDVRLATGGLQRRPQRRAEVRRRPLHRNQVCGARRDPVPTLQASPAHQALSRQPPLRVIFRPTATKKAVVPMTLRPQTQVTTVVFAPLHRLAACSPSGLQHLSRIQRQKSAWRRHKEAYLSNGLVLLRRDAAGGIHQAPARRTMRAAYLGILLLAAIFRRLPYGLWRHFKSGLRRNVPSQAIAQGIHQHHDPSCRPTSSWAMAAGCTLDQTTRGSSRRNIEPGAPVSKTQGQHRREPSSCTSKSPSPRHARHRAC